jgi:hypothetical protein
MVWLVALLGTTIAAVARFNVVLVKTFAGMPVISVTEIIPAGSTYLNQ